MTAPTSSARILRDALAQVAAIDAATLPEDGLLEQDPGADGLALHELVVTLETRLNVVIRTRRPAAHQRRPAQDLARLGHPTGEGSTA
ncbi:hypothetical protein GCM10010442_51040 [Kitasatospora kifunensis]